MKTTIIQRYDCPQIPIAKNSSKSEQICEVLRTLYTVLGWFWLLSLKYRFARQPNASVCYGKWLNVHNKNTMT